MDETEQKRGRERGSVGENRELFKGRLCKIEPCGEKNTEETGRGGKDKAL